MNTKTNNKIGLKTVCGCVCHDPKHKGLIHDSICCEGLEGSLEYQAVKKLLAQKAPPDPK